MNKSFSVRPSVLEWLSDVESIDVPIAKQSADQACDIVMVLGPDMLPAFAAALHEAQRRKRAAWRCGR